MLRSLLAAAGCCLLLLRIPALAWQTGRATWFDVHENDLTTANCHLGWSEVSTGRFIAALADVNPLFDGSCGMCIEIRCQNANFRDGYGKSLDRSDACRNSRSIITTVADACPCEYPNNAYSNRRWCCGDDSSRPHIDITREAFNELANLRVGVIAIEWRIVDCRTHVPVDGSGPSQDSAPLERPSVPLPSAGELDRIFDHRPFATSVGSGTNLASAQSASAAGLQQDAQEMAADRLQSAKERWGRGRRLQ